VDYQNLFIVDNSKTEWSVKRYLNDWCEISSQFDIATGYFEIGGLLEIDGKWQKLEKIRILFGDEVTKRTKEVFENALYQIADKLDNSIENEKEVNEYLIGVPAIISAIKKGKIGCRVYNKEKFHAKAYITYMKKEYFNSIAEALHISNGHALVGSSNFTRPGLNQNIELNVQVSQNVNQLQDWYEYHWNEGKDITIELLKVLEKHVKEYIPYDIYLRSMYEYFKSQGQTVTEWEKNQSFVYSILSQYQKDGYHALIQIANKYNGAFLCDGVGLGKTFVGLMLIERLVLKERKNVVLMVPASTRESVWEINIKKYIPQILDGFYSFKIMNHTDLVLEKNINIMQKIGEQAECIIIDEAHNFRNRASSRYRKLYEMIGLGNKKQLFMLTATPINNSFLDFQHMIELFTQRNDSFFKQPPLGVHSIIGHFRKMENSLDSVIDNKNNDTSVYQIETDNIFKSDILVNELVIQRSRTYVKKSLNNLESDTVLFPKRNPPQVAEYSLKKGYGKLIDHFTSSFYRIDKATKKIKPILFLSIYSPYDAPYFIGDIDKIDEMKKGRQMQVVNLIRMLLLKRFESSGTAFEETCIKIFVRLYRFVVRYKNENTVYIFERFINRKSDIIDYVNLKYLEENDKEIDESDDDFPDYVWETEENLNVEDFDIERMITDTINDLEVLAVFLDDLRGFNAENDDKVQCLIRLLKNDEKLKDKKVIIFTEYRSTAKYIYKILKEKEFKNIYELDGQTKVYRKDIITRFSPYYNDSSVHEITDEIDILISTDVLAEGLNLQDATCLINYELHWNPVKLMQRIGRVDRRRNSSIEMKILIDHPELISDRENVYYWNFLPPEELEQLLSLYEKVAKKTLRISKAFGIEGKKLLTPDDDYDALKEFNSAYEGTETKEEEMILAYEELMKNNPDYNELINELPKRMYSGKIKSNKKGVFFCYKLPVKSEENDWNIDEGICRWYIYNSDEDRISEHTYEIWNSIKSDTEDVRLVSITVEEFLKYKKIVDNHIKRTYLKLVQAPISIKQKLISWMELY
jgi:ERCC4-related helicase